MIKKQITTERTSCGCYLVDSHALNHDGYSRLMFNPTGNDRKMYMTHRVVYESVYGGIPDGYEIDHTCKNRSCVNPNHLRCLSATDHRSKDNFERHGSRKGEAFLHWKMNLHSTGAELARLFGVGETQGGRWVKDFKDIEL